MCVVILTGAKDPANEDCQCLGRSVIRSPSARFLASLGRTAQKMNEARRFASNLFQPVK